MTNEQNADESYKTETDYIDQLFAPTDHIHNETLIAMCLCQITLSRFDSQNDVILNLLQSPVEEALMSFVSNFGLSLKCRSDDSDCIKYIV